jgi:hypothetical protein
VYRCNAAEQKGEGLACGADVDNGSDGGGEREGISKCWECASPHSTPSHIFAHKFN